MKAHAIIILMAIFFTGCSEDKIYYPKDVKIISEGITEEGLKLTFRPMPESMYSCPGVTYEKKGDQIFFEFVRRNVNRKDTDIHLSAIQDADGNLSVTFPMSETQERIELINSSGKSLGEWKRELKRDNH